MLAPQATAVFAGIRARRSFARRARSGAVGSPRPVVPDRESGGGPARPPEPEPVRTGDIWVGKWRIGALLGQGAMGSVYVAHHLRLKKTDAIKFLSPQAWTNADALIRFQREAQAAAAIPSEHVVRVWDHGIEKGVPYIVMEHLGGRDLNRWLSDRGSLPVAQATDFILQACNALHEAHALGIIHRDIKPANLFAVERDGKVETIKVLDFGISKASGLVAPTVKPSEWVPTTGTEDRILMGSAHYMSPEQMESARDVDEGTDIWALGVTLYELLAGRLPYVGQSFLQVYTSIVAGGPTPLRHHIPEVPPGLEQAVDRCLRRRREERFRTVSELAAALVPFGSKRAASYVERVVPSVARMEAATSIEGTPPTPPPALERGLEKTMASGGRLPRVAPPSVAVTPAPPDEPRREARREVGGAVGTAGSVRSAPRAAVAVVLGALATWGAWAAWSAPATRGETPGVPVGSAATITPPAGSAASSAPPVQVEPLAPLASSALPGAPVLTGDARWAALIPPAAPLAPALRSPRESDGAKRAPSPAAVATTTAAPARAATTVTSDPTYTDPRWTPPDVPK
jgi:serine/threonine-protein kinase